VPAHRIGIVDADQVRRWEHLYDATVAADKFFYAVTFFITSGIRP